MDDIQAREVKWYRANGKYPDRITSLPGNGSMPYVIGDYSFNKPRFLKGREPEFIERIMARETM